MFCPMRGGFFILQLHDELLYEVAEEDVVQVFLLCTVHSVGNGDGGGRKGWSFTLHREFGSSLAWAGWINVESIYPGRKDKYA